MKNNNSHEIMNQLLQNTRNMIENIVDKMDKMEKVQKQHQNQLLVQQAEKERKLAIETDESASKFYALPDYEQGKLVPKFDKFDHI